MPVALQAQVLCHGGSWLLSYPAVRYKTLVLVCAVIMNRNPRRRHALLAVCAHPPTPAAAAAAALLAET